MPTPLPPIPSFDPRPQNEPLLPEIKEAIARVLESGKFIGGEFVEAFEREFASAVEASHAVAVASGTDALLVALMALGVGPGDGVVTTPFTFFATAGVVRRLGATPLFADIDAASLNLSPERVAELLERRAVRLPAGMKTCRPRVLLPVHLFGRSAALEPLAELAGHHGLDLIEDVAQAFGGRRGRRSLGTFGRLGCFSFYPTKNLGGLGDGGAVTTEDAELAARLRMLRNHGQWTPGAVPGTNGGAGTAGAGKPYEHHVVGGNFRLDALQCAALRTKLPHVATWNRERVALAQRYTAAFKACELERDVPVHLPVAGADGEHVFHQYVVRLPRRDDLKSFLAARGIGSAVYYPLPLHLQPCFRDLGYRMGDLPEAERAAGEVLALPIYPGLAPAQVDQVVAAIRTFYRG